jgi:ATP-binding cassette subfamily B protein
VNNATNLDSLRLDADQVATEGLGLKGLAKLFWRTWPYFRPQLRHLVTWIVASLLIDGLFIVATLVAYDLFNNKVLVGEKLEQLQVTVLRLDRDYLADVVSTNQEPNEPQQPGSDTASDSKLTQEQRRVVRDRLMLVFAVVAFFSFALIPIIEYYRTWILQRVNQYLRVTMIEQAEHLSLRYHSHARIGDAIYRVYQDSAMITSVIEYVVLQPVLAFGQLLFSFGVICLFSLTLGFMFLAGMLPIIWLVSWYTPRLQWRSRQARASNSDLTSRIQEAFAAIRVVKANQAERIMGERFDRDSTGALDAAFYLRVELLLMRTGVMVIAGCMLFGSQYLAAGWTVAGEPTFLAGAIALVGFTAWNLGAFEAVGSQSRQFIWNGEHLLRTWGLLQDLVVGLDRAFFLLDLEPDVVDKEGAAPMPRPIREVSFQEVSFGYDASKPILKGVSLRANTGTITAIVGATGSGKSTLMSLLLRLYDPDAGAIMINGMDLRDIQVDSLRAGAAIALQQNTLFAASVADNIAYASTKASRVAVEAAAKIACADDFIRAMPNGYDTELGERGGKLSTGQRQRLSVARAVLRDTPILILDEPTASLDAETEQQVLANLADWGHDRIVFLITHRLSTIRNADQIAFLLDGVITELGNHESLMAHEQGHYRQFVTAETANPQHEAASDPND